MKKFFNKSSLITLFIFVLLLIIGITYRALFLHAAFWYDEACSWATAICDFPYGIMNNLLNVDLQHTPLYFFLLHFWIKLFGDSEFAIRFLSFLFGIASLPLVYVVARKLSSKILAFVSMAVASVSPILVMFSDEARMYPLVLFLVLLSFNYFKDVFDGVKNANIKLTIVNVLIPYTLVGGIFYNFSLLILGLPFFFTYRKNLFKKYLKYVFIEWLLLIPYFILIIYYAIQRFHFVIRHEGSLFFPQIVDLIRNFFSIVTVPNLYWPDSTPIVPDFKFFVVVFIPCVYFVYGFISGLKKSEGFTNLLYKIVLLNFGLFILSSLCGINVCTIRYILYILPLIFILSIIGLSKSISKLHLIIFALFFTISSMFFNVGFANLESEIKQNAFKAVRIEADKLNLNNQDIIIMPFGSDAPYYFRTAYSPRVLNFDLHKEFRNPYNPKIYDSFQQKFMYKKQKYNMIFDRVQVNEPFSNNFVEFFINNVNSTVNSGRFVLLALYADDASSLLYFDDLQKLASTVDNVKKNPLGIVLSKHLLDVRNLLDLDFDFLGTNVVNSYTFLLYRKR